MGLALEYPPRLMGSVNLVWGVGGDLDHEEQVYAIKSHTFIDLVSEVIHHKQIYGIGSGAIQKGITYFKFRKFSETPGEVGFKEDPQLPQVVLYWVSAYKDLVGGEEALARQRHVRIGVAYALPLIEDDAIPAMTGQNIG